MKDCRKFYINGAWVAPKTARDHQVINPSTEEPCGTISLGAKADVDDAVAAARRAFTTFSQTTREQRLELLQSIMTAYQAHLDEMAETISVEMGAPLWLSKAAQAMAPLGHLGTMIQVLSTYEFESVEGSTLFRHEPIGVCGRITPWNWLANRDTCEVLSRIAGGCSVALE